MRQGTSTARRRQAGFTLLELLIAVTVIGISMVTMLQQLAITHRDIREGEDNWFAYERAAAMLAELQSDVDSGRIESVSELEAQADVEPNPVLTTRRDGGLTVEPDHPMSGNGLMADGVWRWSRTIDVQPVEAGVEMSYVTVKMARREPGGRRLVEASISGVLNLLPDASPSVKQYDVYLLAIDAAPSLWMPLPALRSMIESAAARVQQQNPNLEFRLHWITKFGYGRDSQYVPFVNETLPADRAAPWVYWYPGKLGADAPVSQLFLSNLFSGRVRTGAGVLNDYDATDNPLPHAVADRFNHCARTPRARDIFAARVAQGLESPDEPPLQLLLEDMHAGDPRFRNAILINLHGEGLPFPPVRNYSDPAKDAAGRPGVRVVTHPARLWTPRGVGADSTDTLDLLIADVEALVLARTPSSKIADIYADLHSAAEELRDGDDGELEDALEDLEDARERVGRAVREGELTPEEGEALKSRIQMLYVYLDSGRGAAYPTGGDSLLQIIADVETIVADNPSTPLADKMEDVEQWLRTGQFELHDQDRPDASAAVGNLEAAQRDLDAAVRDSLLPAAEGRALRDRIQAIIDSLNAGDGWVLPGIDQPVELRVYAYKTGPDSGPAVLDEPITVQILGVDLTGDVNGGSETTLEIRRLVGGVDTATGLATGSDRDYAHFDEPVGLPPRLAERAAPHEMCYEVGYSRTPEPHTWIRLHGTPLVSTVCNDEGLPTEHRLYGLEYVPSPVVAKAFAVDLDTDGSRPKNTARWQISIPRSSLRAGFGDADTRITVRTRIGTDTTTGTAWPVAHQPGNLSETYTWWTEGADVVPLTERYQFLGDPRHNPYADLVAGGATSPHGYNRFFDDLRSGDQDATAAWPCLDAARLRDGFAGGVVADVPRMMQVWRDALQSARAVFTNVNGRVAGALLLGGEIALPPAPGGLQPMPVTLDGALFGASDRVVHEEVSPDGGPGLGATVVMSAGSFWAKEWLGELCPDGRAVDFATSGNLPCGAGYRRALRRVASIGELPAGTSFAFPSGASLRDLGAATLIHQGTPTSRFQHALSAADNLIALTDRGVDILAAAGADNQTPSVARRPFHFDGPLSEPLPHVQFGDDPEHAATLLERWSTDTNRRVGAGVVRLADPNDPVRQAFFAIVSDTPVAVAEHGRLVDRALLFGLRGLHAAGNPSLTYPVEQVPQVEILAPGNPARLAAPVATALSWRTEYSRFDGQRYTASYPEGAGADEAQLVYVITYSRDGEPFRHVETGAFAELGVLPADESLWVADSEPGDETLIVDLPADQFPAGEYVFRVDCFNQSRLPHSSHHQVTLRIYR